MQQLGDASPHLMRSEHRESKGVLTLAVGNKPYIAQAINLARSIRVHNPQLPLAVVTDSNERRLLRAFDIVHQLNADLGGPYRQKLCLDQYSQFSQTLFIDSDCLVFRNLSPLFTELKTESFCTPTIQVSTGTWYRDIEGWLDLLKGTAIPRHNSGCFCFANTPDAKQFFSTALWYYDRLSEFGIPKTHSSMPDEPAIAMALLACGIECPEFDSSVQFSPLCGTIPFNYSVLRGRIDCIRADGVRIKPYILHCLAGEWAHWRYRREALKLKLTVENGISNSISETLMNSWFCAIYGWRRRMSRMLRSPS